MIMKHLLATFWVASCLTWVLSSTSAQTTAPTTSSAKDQIIAPVKTSTREDTFEFGRFGLLHVMMPAGKPTSVALFATDASGWNDDAKAIANTLAQSGALVAGIDSGEYLRTVQGSDEYCTYPGGELEDLAHGVEKHYAIANYLSPVLVGIGQGADLWYVAMAQEPGGTFRALLTLGFCPQLALQHLVCDGRVLRSEKTATRVQLKPSNLAEQWIALSGSSNQQCPAKAANDFIAQVPGAQMVTLPAGKSRADEVSALLANYQTLSAPTPVARALPAKVEDLPLVEVPAQSKPEAANADKFAIIITGDGGWAGLDRDVADGFSQSGIPVAGLSSLKYFWQLRTPEQTAHDLERIINYYLATWHRSRVVLIGYSFGADALPAVFNKLSVATRAKVASINLVGLGQRASFEIHVSAWLQDYSEGPAIKPEVDRIAIPVLCIRGDDEDDSLCPQLQGRNVRKLDLPGGHHFNGDYSTLVKAMLTTK
jgi:type IV secretory pathway VirJ component